MRRSLLVVLTNLPFGSLAYKPYASALLYANLYAKLVPTRWNRLILNVLRGISGELLGAVGARLTGEYPVNGRWCE